MAITVDEILQEIRAYRPKANLNRIKRAYSFAKKFYAGRERLSGFTYIDFLMEVVSVLLNLKPDEDTLSATLLQGVVKDDSISLDDIRNKFGKNVSDLLDGIKKLGTIKSRVKESEVETLQKMFLAIAKDLRVVLIKLASRLVSLRTLEFVDAESRKRIARETMDVYVPVASRLGVYNIKSQMEDLAFKYLYPGQYNNIADQLISFGVSKSAVIDGIKGELKEFLTANGIKAEVDGRLKSVSSIYRKLKKKSRTSVDEVFDIFAMRIVLPTRFQGSVESYESLYSVLGLIHSKWVPLANRFKDYIAVPKPNGYQSLHTTVLGLGPKEYSRPVEIQIRSERMHKEAEYGIASHWLYESTSGLSTRFDRDAFLNDLSAVQNSVTNGSATSKNHGRHMEWLRGLAKLQENLQTQADSYEDLKVDIFNDRIFVLTPQGEVKDLPVSATPIDFAYSVHTDLGHRCAMAKVNGSLVPLDYELKNGDVVEIILKPKPNPKPHWLSFVKTGNAKARIKAWLKGLDRERNIKEGRELLNKHLRRYGKPLLDDSCSVLKNYDGKKLTLKERVALLEEIGTGSQLANVVVKKLFAAEKLLESISVEDSSAKKAAAVPKAYDPTNEILIGGEGGLPMKLASCCAPEKGSEIVAYITRGHSITIHRRDCPYVSNLDEERLLDATWGYRESKPSVTYRVRFFIEAVGRVGLLRDITSIIATSGADIVDFEMKSRTGDIFLRAITLEVSSFDQFDKILDKIEHVQNVLRVEKDM